MSLTEEMFLTEEIRQYTFSECLECCSVHQMYYCNGYYTCEECYRDVNIDDVEVEDLFVNWVKFRNLVANSTSPKKMIEILVYRIFRTEYTKEEIDQYYNDLLDHGCFNIAYVTN